MLNPHSYFHIVYDGPALESNEMDIKELAPALMAISDALEEANRIFNKGRATVGINVKGSFKTGCFDIDLSVNQALIDSLVNIFSEDKVVAGATLLQYLGLAAPVVGFSGKGLLQVIKWLNNRKIKKIDIKEDGTANITLTDDDMTSVEKEIIALLRSYTVRKSLERAVVDPLQRAGINSFYCGGDLVHADSAKFFTIDKSEIDLFIAPEPYDEVIDNSTREANLQAVSVSFYQMSITLAGSRQLSCPVFD